MELGEMFRRNYTKGTWEAAEYPKRSHCRVKIATLILEPDVMPL